MAEWNSNNRACTTTWSTLRVLDQNDRVFSKSGTVKMSQLTFWNPSATPAMRRIQATALANQIDNVFRIIRGAKYEKNVTQQKAIDNTVKTLLDAEQTICDLAKECDDNYLFWKEGDE